MRAARLAGLPVARLVLVACFLAGRRPGWPGMVEVAAVHGSANASLVAGYGYAGILVAFIARHNPLAIVPVAILLGGHRRQRRPAAAPPRPARRHRPRAAGHRVSWSSWRARRCTARVRPGLSAARAGDGLTSEARRSDAGWGVPLAVLGGAIRVSTPFLFVSLGECLTEKSGRINLGLEGTLVMGAMTRLRASRT